MKGVALVDVLGWLTGPDQGAFLVVSVFAAVILEDFAFWHALKSSARYLIILAGAVLLGLGASVLQTRPELVAAIDPYWTPVAYSILAWLAAQGIHEAGKLSRPK
jgi:hypothetical protein